MSYWSVCAECGEPFIASLARTWNGVMFCNAKCELAARAQAAHDRATIAEGVRDPVVTNTAVAAKHELAFAAEVGGRRVHGSGSAPGLCGDVITDDWFFELKTTRGDSKLRQRRSFTLTTELLDKAAREALRSGRKMAMVIRIEGHEVVVVDKQDFLGVIDVGQEGSGD